MGRLPDATPPGVISVELQLILACCGGLRHNGAAGSIALGWLAGACNSRTTRECQPYCD